MGGLESFGLTFTGCHGFESRRSHKFLKNFLAKCLNGQSCYLCHLRSDAMKKRILMALINFVGSQFSDFFKR